MKKLILCIGLIGTALYGCKKINPTEGVEKIVDVTFSNSSVSFQFVDAKTGEQLDLDGKRNIEIKITGKNAADVVDNFGGKQIGADYGIMAVALKEGVVPSRTNQVFFTVQAETDGYLPSSKEVVMLQEGSQHYVIEMINVNDVPAGMSLKQDIISAVPNTGITGSDFTLSPSELTETGTTASVKIPSGTKLMDAAGKVVSGNVSATMAYTNPSDANFSKIFPGSSDVAPMNDGTYSTFKTLGLVSMELTASGTEVKKFGTPIQMTIQIPAGSKDLDGKDVAAGSTFGVYSYDNTTGKWTHESDEKVVSNNGKLEVTFAMSHLSSWQVADKKQTSDYYNYNEFIFNGSCPNYFSNQNNIYFKMHKEGISDIEFGVANTTLNKTFYIVASHFENDNLVWYQKDNLNNFISAVGTKGASRQTVTFPSSWCPQVTPKDFKIKLTTSCPDRPDRKIKPQCFVFKWKQGGMMEPLGQMLSGELKTSTSQFEDGKKYALVTFYQNKMVVLTGNMTNFDFGFRTFDGSDVDLSRPLTTTECNYIRGN
jgi:hypothetical protein